MKDIISFIGFILRSMLIVIVTIFYACVALLLGLSGIRKAYFILARQWSAVLLKCAGVQVQINGMQYLHPLQSRIYVVNHTSYFDIPILLASIPDTVRIMYRKNLERIPFMGWSLAASPFIGIQREKARDAMKGIEEAVKSVSIGESVVIFAEGTRSKDGRLGTFKRGAFLLASRSGKQLLPIALIGAQDIMPKDELRFYPGTVTMNLLPPIEPISNMSREEEVALQQSVHALINEALPEEMKSRNKEEQ
ncbi:MAG: 1-acyl-sn-glycerol-3-phosphate acyltransferase [Bacteroidetes bacterium]|nr:1-acyl-sn-glycerol-3-phosphate acyltransferase [bacterium]NBP63938.1 1-acyl-sn-glycerol-3-phosphate acyltransferase [Bacteroidota bacterium]